MIASADGGAVRLEATLREAILQIFLAPVVGEIEIRSGRKGAADILQVPAFPGIVGIKEGHNLDVCVHFVESQVSRSAGTSIGLAQNHDVPRQPVLEPRQFLFGRDGRCVVNDIDVHAVVALLHGDRTKGAIQKAGFSLEEWYGDANHRPAPVLMAFRLCARFHPA